MKHNNQQTDEDDEIRVDINNPLEIEFLHRQFPKKTHEEIKSAIRNKGPFRRDIVNHLKENKGVQ